MLDPIPLLKSVVWWGYVAPTLVWCSILGPIIVLASPMLKEKAGSWPRFFLMYGGMLLFVGPFALAVWAYQAAESISPRWQPSR